MIKIKLANETDSEVLALLGRVTYLESHGHYIEDKNDLAKYVDETFSVAKTKMNLRDSKNLFYLIYANDLPVGYAKLVLNSTHESVPSKNNGQLEKIYILNDFIPMKLGIKLLSFVEEKAKELSLDMLWLSVYIKNHRAIKFYQKNNFKNVGELNFLVNGTEYKNFVLSKKI